MDIGLLFPFRNPPQWRKPWSQFYAEQLRQIQTAEELGYDTIWLTEHHFAEDGYSPSLLPIAGAIAAMTTRVRIGTYLLLLPLHNALRVAEDAATVDILSNGRFDLGVGQGYAVGEFEIYGIPRNQRGSLIEEGVEVIRGLWSEDPFSYSGKHYNFKNVSLVPKPTQTPPPLWIGAGAKKAVERAARLGCHFLGTSSPNAQLIYDAELRRNGRNPDDFNAAQLRFTYVAESHDQAWDEAQHHLHYMLKWYGRWLSEANDFPGAEEMANTPSPEELRNLSKKNFSGDNFASFLNAPIVGTPEQVTRAINAMTENVRTTHLVLGMHLPGMDPAKSQKSMELFAKEVKPGLTGL
nr:D440 [uncultured bacterium]